MPEFVGSPLTKWRAIPLDHRLKSLLRPGAEEEEEEEGERRSKSTILAQELAITWCGGAGGAKGGVEGKEKQYKHLPLKSLLKPECGAKGEGGEGDEKQHKHQRLKSLLRRGARGNQGLSCVLKRADQEKWNKD